MTAKTHKRVKSLRQFKIYREIFLNLSVNVYICYSIRNSKNKLVV